MNEWVSFFIGSPKRFLSTCAGIAVVAAIIKPELVLWVVVRLLEAVNPVLGPILQLAFLVMAIRIMFSGFCSKKKKK